MRRFSLAICVLAVPAWAGAACDTTCGLSDFNRELMLEYLLNRNTAPLASASVDAYFAVTPGGIETREEALASVDNLDIAQAEVYTHRIEVIGDTAVLAGKVRVEGTIGGRPTPELGFLSVFSLVDGEWRLLARSLTPQAAGRPETSAGDEG